MQLTLISTAPSRIYYYFEVLEVEAMQFQHKTKQENF